MIEINFIKTHKDAKLPQQNNTHVETGDTGYDIYAVEDTIILGHSSKNLFVGLKVAYITPSYWFKIESRSGLSFKHEILSHPGIIDNQYRGELGIKLYNHSNTDYKIKKGDKIAQMSIYKLNQAKLSFTEEVNETDRGNKGFGSSDNKS